MSLDVDALRESFDLVIARSPRMTDRFYQILFERHPEARPLFGASIEAQQEMLTRTLVAVIERVDDGVWLTDMLQALGEKHADYGVTPEMFPPLLNVVRDTAKEHLREHWTPQMDDAWRERLDRLHARLMDAAQTTG